MKNPSELIFFDGFWAEMYFRLVFMPNNFVPEMRNFVTHGFFLALILIALP